MRRFESRAITVASKRLERLYLEEFLRSFPHFIVVAEREAPDFVLRDTAVPLDSKSFRSSGMLREQGQKRKNSSTDVERHCATCHSGTTIPVASL